MIRLTWNGFVRYQKITRHMTRLTWHGAVQYQKITEGPGTSIPEIKVGLHTTLTDNLPEAIQEAETKNQYCRRFLPAVVPKQITILQVVENYYDFSI